MDHIILEKCKVLNYQINLLLSCVYNVLQAVYKPSVFPSRRVTKIGKFSCSPRGSRHSIESYTLKLLFAVLKPVWWHVRRDNRILKVLLCPSPIAHFNRHSIGSYALKLLFAVLKPGWWHVRWDKR
ncbi:hypothetical protein AG1IA_09500 [Rhizoctonia solani AG-1 IA]|uniref:Uncharacterized protein n=1 Tax=Thanatephorus cucumeris (strain AG1-IA) TaxID=983506 RepID=L8WJC1_THACA|nr:hypothetical protein AG1IA_09500 [Rhizoctonia solani AG-1 IA]